MNRQAVNPYLPSWEYIPDGEPHVFNGRVYVYGSHDRFNAPIFCVNDYVCWSAPVEDLSEWRYEGVIYRKKQDPKNPLGYHLLFAPDVCQGPDGRYYLYYAFDFLGIMSVTVDYSLYERASLLIDAAGAKQAAPQFTDRVALCWQMPEHTEGPLLEQLRELTRGSAQVTVSDPFYAPF